MAITGMTTAAPRIGKSAPGTKKEPTGLLASTPLTKTKWAGKRTKKPKTGVRK